jgi:hypothetical protein
VRRTHTAKIEAFTQYIGMVANVEVSYLVEGLIHTYVYSSEWYKDFVNAVGLAPLKLDKDLQA